MRSPSRVLLRRAIVAVMLIVVSVAVVWQPLVESASMVPTDGTACTCTASCSCTTTKTVVQTVRSTVVSTVYRTIVTTSKKIVTSTVNSTRIIRQTIVTIKTILTTLTRVSMSTVRTTVVVPRTTVVTSTQVVPRYSNVTLLYRMPAPGFSSYYNRVLQVPPNTVYFVGWTDVWYRYEALNQLHYWCRFNQPVISAYNAASYLNTTSGKPLFNGDLVLVGGPSTNIVVNYYDTKEMVSKIGLADNATYHIFTKPSLAAYAEPIGYNPTRTYYFVIQTYNATDGRHVYAFEGLTDLGTYASAVYFGNVIMPNIATYTQNYYIYRWVDANQNAIPETSEIALVASGL